MVALVAGKAALLDLFGGGVRETEDLGGISAGVDVLLAGSVTAFAGDSFAAVCEHHLGVRVAAEGRSFCFVAHCAGGCACKLRFLCRGLDA